MLKKEWHWMSDYKQQKQIKMNAIKLELYDFEIEHIIHIIKDDFKNIEQYRENKYLYPKFNEVENHYMNMIDKLNKSIKTNKNK